ncbi:hypothetical protein KSF_037930 [Reticulibacter mediterranei]|uniref:TIR domain-containing protein n=1 Tax=Reticulibacter mediterranei TaxID=2778369 RepID=A0A8J3N316_9CHLR|nr:toll/interleukin-1 receptor domain-containing protein [Reticulibacter mediterranei]GHO93745.1 hypothetical protein KSF_037930 [Reticulibacter mediterranei]
MVNQQQLQQLRQASKSWNTWREQHPGMLISLTGADLIEANLAGANLSNAILLGARLTRAKLSHANLSGADLGSTYLMETNLTRANLSGAILTNAHLNDARLNDASLAHATLGETDLSRANLTGANLERAILANANLFGADFSYANLTGANLTGANLIETDLSYANLTGADLSYATVGWTILGDVDLRTVKGLETVQHLGPSTIGTDTIARSRGQVPKQFLREAGIYDLLTDSVQSLAQSSKEYFTHLINFSRADVQFANRLFADLQSKNIYCWSSPEDEQAKWQPGSFNEIMRRYDRLLLVFSADTLASSWIEAAVHAALIRERQTNQAVLFPLCLDTALNRSMAYWSVSLCQTRQISDFTGWEQKKQHYQRGLQQLLRALYPETH